MGSICQACVYDKDHEFLTTRAVTVPESIKPSIIFMQEYPIESEYSSIPVLSLPSISPNSSFRSISTPKSSSIFKSNQIREFLSIETYRKISQYNQTFGN